MSSAALSSRLFLRGVGMGSPSLPLRGGVIVWLSTLAPANYGRPMQKKISEPSRANVDISACPSRFISTFNCNVCDLNFARGEQKTISRFEHRAERSEDH